MIDQIFHVATEFQFTVGQAVLSSNQLAGAVGNISSAADTALAKLQGLGGGLVAHLGLGSGGLLTILSKAVSISDRFNQSSLSFANIISSNMDKFSGTIDNFNDRLATSQMIMGNINKIANQFALPSESLLHMAELVTPVLAQHGMAGKNFGTSIEISKNVLKSAPNLGINPMESENQLMNMLNGQAMTRGIFGRLLRDTNVFKNAHVMNTAQFDALPPAKRIDLVRKALAVFSSDTDVLKNRVNSLHGQMTILENNFENFGSVLRPIGDAIIKPLVGVLKQVNQYIDTQGRQMAKSMGAMIANIFEQPKNLLVNLMQLSHLHKDVKKGGNLFGFIEGFLFVSQIAKFLGFGKGPWALIGTGLMKLRSGLMYIAAMVPWMTVFSTVFRVAAFVFTNLLPKMLAAVMLFQTLSRARAIARIEDAKKLLLIMPVFMDLFTRLKVALENIFSPFTTAMDALANIIAPFLEISTYADAAVGPLTMVVEVLELVGIKVMQAQAGFEGLVFAIAQFVDNIRGGNFLHPTAGVGKAFNAGMDDFFERNSKRLFDKNGAVVNQVTNVGKIEIRNDFKENQEPDRIAFTIKDQIMKAARNPKSARGSSLQGAFAR